MARRVVLAAFYSTLVSLCVTSIAAPTYAVPVNANPFFDSGLADWSTEGSVADDGGEAVLTDAVDSAGYSALYQGTAGGTGDYTLEFDFLAGLSGEVPDGTFLDAVFVSLYFVNDLSSFDLVNLVFDDAVALFDSDSTGELVYEGTVSASGVKQGWQHYALSFTSSFSTVIPAFELFDLNFIAGDSSFRVDNVVLTKVTPPTEIPEPGSLLLFALAGVPAIRRRIKGL